MRIICREFGEFTIERILYSEIINDMQIYNIIYHLKNEQEKEDISPNWIAGGSRVGYPHVCSPNVLCFISIKHIVET